MPRLLPLKAGTHVGQYKVGRILRHDELGITYACRDMALERDVSIAEYLPLDIAVRHGDSSVVPCSMRWAEDFHWGRNRFLAEARILGELAGTPAIVGVHDALEANGTAYVVTHRVRGQTLAARLARHGTLPRDAVERLLPPLLEGLDRVHARDLLHLGITPSTIMVDREGRPTLIGFRAVAAALAARRQVTVAHAPGYAAIELVSDGHTGPATDIYALAATLYRCVTGATPLTAINRLTEQMNPATQQAAGRYPYGLLAAIDAGLAFRSAERPASIAGWRPVFNRRALIPVPPDVAALVPASEPLPSVEPEDASEPQPWSGARAAFVMTWTALGNRLSSFTGVDRWRQQLRSALLAATNALNDRLPSLAARIDVGVLQARMRSTGSAVTRRASMMVARVRARHPRPYLRMALDITPATLRDRLSAFVTYIRDGGRRTDARMAIAGLAILVVTASPAASKVQRPDSEPDVSLHDRPAASQEAAGTQSIAERQPEEEAARRAKAERIRAAAEAKRQEEADRQAAERARAEAEAQQRAEARARAEAAHRQQEAERQAATERARAEAWQRAEVDAKRAEAEVARQQEEAARRVAEERARVEAEVRQRAEAEARARAEAEAKRQQEEAARQAAAERARVEAIAAREQAEAASRRQAEDEARRAAAEKAAAVERQQAEAAERTLALSPRDRRRVQVALTSLGFDTGGIDEVFGPRTRQMIGSWQKRQGMSDTGFLTAALARYDAEEAGPTDRVRRAELADTTGSEQGQVTTTRRGASDVPAVAALAPTPDAATRSEEYRGSRRIPLYGSNDPRMYAEYTLILRVARSTISGVVTRYCPACAPDGGEERRSYPCNAETLRFGSGFSLHCDPISVWGDLESARIHHSANLGGIAIPLARTNRGG